MDPKQILSWDTRHTILSSYIKGGMRYCSWCISEVHWYKIPPCLLNIEAHALQRFHSLNKSSTVLMAITCLKAKYNMCCLSKNCLSTSTELYVAIASWFANQSTCFIACVCWATIVWYYIFMNKCIDNMIQLLRWYKAIVVRVALVSNSLYKTSHQPLMDHLFAWCLCVTIFALAQ